MFWCFCYGPRPAAETFCVAEEVLKEHAEQREEMLRKLESWKLEARDVFKYFSGCCFSGDYWSFLAFPFFFKGS